MRSPGVKSEVLGKVGGICRSPGVKSPVVEKGGG